MWIKLINGQNYLLTFFFPKRKKTVCFDFLQESSTGLGLSL